MSETTGELGLPKPVNHAPPPAFTMLVELCEQLEHIKGVGSILKRHNAISEFINTWKTKIGNDIYPAFQLLMPNLNEIYGRFKEHVLGKIIVKSLNLNPTSHDALILTTPRRVFTKTSNEVDLGVKTMNALSTRKTRDSFSDMRINDLIKILDKFSISKLHDQVDMMTNLIQQLSPLEMKWVVRILLKAMHFDCSERMFIQNFHPSAWDVFKVSSNLRVICDQLWDSTIELESIDKNLKPLLCFKTMQAKYIPNLKVVESKFRGYDLKRCEFYIEDKVDGERVQLHYTKCGENCKYYSRRGTDFTHIYGANRMEGSLTPYLNLNAESCILDGEMVAYDVQNNEICAFSSVRQAHKVPNSKLVNIFFVFDIVYKNGRDLTNMKLKSRKQILEKTVLESKYVKILPYKLGNSALDIQLELDRVLKCMCEGLVIKHPLSKYMLDSRVDAWIKIKPEYVHGYNGENFDLIVVGAYRGKSSGRLRSVYSSFLCALKNDKIGSEFMSICRVGSGFNTAIYEYIYEHIEQNAEGLSGGVPSWLCIGNEPKPDVFIHPNKSLVLEIKATQITVHPTNTNRNVVQEYSHFGYSLRFPRFVRIREDKDASMCLRVSEFLEYKEYLDSKYIKSDVRKQSGVTLTAKKLKLAKADTNNVKSTLFKSMKFFIACDVDQPKFMNKQDFAQLIAENSGTVTYLREDAVVIADKWNPSILNTDLKIIYHPRYIFDCLDANKVLPLEPCHYFLGPKQTPNADKYGFSYTRKQPLSELNELLLKMPVPTNIEAPNWLNGCEFDTPVRALLFDNISVVNMNASNGSRDGDVKLACQLIKYGSGKLTSFENANYILQSGNTSCNASDDPASNPMGKQVLHPNQVILHWREMTKI